MTRMGRRTLEVRACLENGFRVAQATRLCRPATLRTERKQRFEVLCARAKITSGFSESFRRGTVTLLKIRNPKLEIRNKPEGPKSESQNQAASRRFEPWSFFGFCFCTDPIACSSPHEVPLLSNASRGLRRSLPSFLWAGVSAKERGTYANAPAVHWCAD